MSVPFSDEEDSTQSSANGTENNINTNQLSVNSTQQVKLSFTVGVMYMAVQGIKIHCSHKYILYMNLKNKVKYKSAHAETTTS